MPRPAGAFELSSCVRRCAARSWLHAVVGIAGLECGEDLLALPNDHPLMQGLERAVWRKVVQGSDPARIQSGGVTPFLRVCGFGDYAAARLVHQHPFWREVDVDLPVLHDHEKWFKRCLQDIGVVELTSDDFWHADWLGLGAEVDVFETWPIQLDWRQCISLDGVYAVVRLLKAARRSRLQKQMRHLEKTFSAAFELLGRSMKLDRSASYAWTCIEHAVLDAPRWPAQPDAAELKDAEDWLVLYEGMPHRAPTRGEALGARRRRIAENAVARRGRHPPLFWFRSASPLTTWLASVRDRAHPLVHAAIDESMGCEVFGPLPGPLQMPEAIYRRRRPIEHGERGWEIFGRPFPDQRIPVDCVPG